MHLRRVQMSSISIERAIFDGGVKEPLITSLHLDVALGQQLSVRSMDALGPGEGKVNCWNLKVTSVLVYTNQLEIKQASFLYILGLYV